MLRVSSNRLDLRLKGRDQRNAALLASSRTNACESGAYSVGVMLFLGAIGLLLVAILGPISLLAILVDPPAAPTPLALTGLGLILWSLSVAAQTGLGYRVTVAWVMVVIALALGVVGFAILLGIGSSVVLGSGAGGVGYLVRGFVFALAAGVVGAWARPHPTRVATLHALRRAALARATAADSRLLAVGPLALFRPEAAPPTEPS